MSALASHIPADWRAALEHQLRQPYFVELERFVTEERARHPVAPAPERVFAALARTPLANVKVVLLGQDPYPTGGNATGLSFSVPPDKRIPPSLKNIFSVLAADVGVKVPDNGCLEPWADRGVLLLNAVLTVREGEAGSHKNRGWERFTMAVLEAVNARPERVVFLLLGKEAQKLATKVDTSRHVIVNTPHPSPLNIGNPFGKTRPFSAVNQALRDAGRGEIDWQLPDLRS